MYPTSALQQKPFHSSKQLHVQFEIELDKFVKKAVNLLKINLNKLLNKFSVKFLCKLRTVLIIFAERIS